MVNEVLCEEVAFDKWEGDNHAQIEEKSLPTRGQNTYKGPYVGMGLGCLSVVNTCVAVEY